MNLDGPRSHTFPEAVVVQFSHLDIDIPDFLEDYPGSLSIPIITAEWEKLVAMGYLQVPSSLWI